jgi:WD40 repeat protein
MLNLWSIDKDGKLKKEAETEHTEQPLITEMTFAPNSQWLATGGENNSVMQWTVPQMTKASIHENHDREIRSLAYVPLGNTTLLASGDNNGQLILCTLPETTNCSAVGKANGVPISSLTVTKNQIFVTSDAIWTWELRSENLEKIATRLADKRLGSATQGYNGATMK